MSPAKIGWELYTKLARLATRIPDVELRRLYCKEIMSLSAMGKRFGVTRERIRQWMERAKIPRRAVGGPRKILLESWPQICKEYKTEGYGGITKVAHKWGVSQETISRIVRKSGIRSQKYKIPMKSWDKVCQDYSRLGSMEKVAKLWGVCINSIREVLVRTGIPRNPRGRSKEWRRKYKEG